MNSNTPQQQNQDDDNGVPVPIIMPPGYQQMAPAQDSPQQTPPPVPGWFAEAPLPDEDPPKRDRRFIPVGRILKILTFVILVTGILGGIGYGLITIFGIADQEADKLATAQEAFNAEVSKTIYLGDGSDIERTATPEVSLRCPTGYKKISGKKECIALSVTVSPLNYSCPKGYDRSGSDKSKCVKIVGGTTEKKSASKNTNCDNGYQKSGDNCIKIEKTTIQKVYSCPAGYTKKGDGAQTSCIKPSAVTSTPLINCPGGYAVGTSSCSRSVDARADLVVKDNACSSPPALPAKQGGVIKACLTAASGTKNSPYCSRSSYTYNSYTGKCNYVVSKVSYIVRYDTIIQNCPAGTTPVGTTYCKQSVALVYGKCYASYSATLAPHCYRLLTRGSSSKPIYGTKCPGGFAARSDGKCVSEVAPDLRDTRSCPPGTSLADGVTYDTPFAGSWCWYLPPKTTVYVCNSGSPSGSKCYFYAPLIYGCKGGFDKLGDGSGTVCSKSDNTLTNPIVKTGCPASYKTAGDGCEKTVTANADSKYLCEDGYKLSGKSCSRIVGGKEVVVSAKKSYKCPANFKASGSGEKMTCTKVGKSKVSLQKAYTCKEGWKQQLLEKSVRCVLLKAQ